MSDTSPLKIVSTEQPVGPITPRTLVAFLFGSSSAIRQIAGSRAATLLGLAMVLLAGFAREYDQESLLHEPWFLLLPVASSIALSLVLWIMCWRTTDVKMWLPLLRCIWFCSPMALLYAIPVERMGDPVWATKLNLTSLGIVSLWRVLLAIRIISVLRQISYLRALAQLMWVVDTLVIVTMLQLKVPLIEIMGGIQFTPVEQILSDVQVTVVPIAFFSWPVWMVAFFVSCHSVPLPTDATCPDSKVDRQTWWPLAACLILAIAGCIWAQPEQRNRYRVEQMVDRNEYELAVNELCEIPRERFPPLWDPPPALQWGRDDELLALTHSIVRHPAAPPWLNDHIEDKLTRNYQNRFRRDEFWYTCSLMNLEDMLVLMDRSPQLVISLDGGPLAIDSDIAKFISRQVPPDDPKAPRRDPSEVIVPPDLLMRLLKHARRLPEGPQVDELEQRLKAMTES